MSIRRTVGRGGNYRSTDSGAGMSEQGIRAYRRANPNSNLQGAELKKNLAKQDVKEESLIAQDR